MKESSELEGTVNLVDNIIDNYVKIEKSLIDQLGLYYKLHQLNTGINREDIWLQLFQMIIPKKFVIEHSVFIIDSYQQVSREVDLAIVDNTYTPYIFQYGKLKFIPIEAVAAVVECKSSSVSFSSEGNSAGTLDDWCNRIKGLHTSQESIARMAAGTVINGILENGSSTHPSSQTSTRPIRIFCGYETEASAKRLSELFDFVLIAKSNELQIHVMPYNLQKWEKELDHYESRAESQESCDKLSKCYLKELEVKKDGKIVSLMTFNFQLNQLLMLINNPILFPHSAYAKMFNHEKREF